MLVHDHRTSLLGPFIEKKIPRYSECALAYLPDYVTFVHRTGCTVDHLNMSCYSLKKGSHQTSQEAYSTEAYPCFCSLKR